MQSLGTPFASCVEERQQFTPVRYMYRFSWGLGGVGGAIIGGTCAWRSQWCSGQLLTRMCIVESPAIKWPGVFDNAPIFIDYPYLLPCTVAACITFTGSF